MCVVTNKLKKGFGVCALALLVGLAGVTSEESVHKPVYAYASELTEESIEAVLTGEAETEQAASDTQAGEGAAATTGAASGAVQSDEPPFNSQEKFVIFVCCLFSVALCVVIGLYGNPNDRLKDKYKRAKRQQLLQEKRKRELAERAAKRAAQEAKYAEEVAQYEADVKAYEEAKAAKAAAKAAKKAEKEAKKK